MKREEIIERVSRVQGLVDDLLDLDAVFSTRQSIVMRGTPRVPLADFQTAVRGRYAAAGYRCEIESAPGSGASRGGHGQDARSTTPGDVSGSGRDAGSDRSGAAIPREFADRVLVTVVVGETEETFPWLNILLFVLTVASVWLSVGGLFAFWFLAILLFHEFGHFIAARRRRIDTSWPYFIPAPVFILPSILGTFGAFIQLRSPIRDRRALFDMAAAGPIAGFVVAVVALFVGLPQSTIVDHGTASGLIFGESLLFKGIAAIVMPAVGQNQDVLLSPIAYAGWAGLLVTMLNLMPIGQLDGGHIAYALFGKKQKQGAIVVMVGLAVLSYWWPGWLFLLAMGLFMRPKHPPTLIDEIPLGRKRRLLGWVSLAILIVTFAPVPISVP